MVYWKTPTEKEDEESQKFVFACLLTRSRTGDRHGFSGDCFKCSLCCLANCCKCFERLSRDVSFHISSGFSCEFSYILIVVSEEFFIASKNISGRNLDTAMRTFGPISLSEVILHNTSAADFRTSSSFSQQNMKRRHVMPLK